MNDDMEIAFSKKNRQKAISLIPVNMVKQEENLLSRTKGSKKNPMAKLSDLFNFMGQIAQPFQHLTPCKKGCSFCCQIRVDVSALEVLYIKKHAKKATKNLPKRLVIGEPCPFLKNDGCSIYEARPYFCRRHQVFTPSNRLCASENDVGQELLAFSEIDKSFFHIVSEHCTGQPQPDTFFCEFSKLIGDKSPFAECSLSRL